MLPKRSTCVLCIGLLFAFGLFSSNLVQAQNPNHKLDGIEPGAYDHANAFGSSSNLPFDKLRMASVQTDARLGEVGLQNDTADVSIIYTTAYPGSKDFFVTVKLKNPKSIAGFDFEITITPPELADFSTVRVYVDSMDTCPALQETCWYFFPIRECLVEPGPWIEDWTFFEAHGARGDTTQPMCDTVWILGLAFTGTPIPPQSNYVTLFEFGVDISCVPDSLTNRTVTFDITGHLSDPVGKLVPFRAYLGKLNIWWSVPGDANNDSLVDVGDIVFLINYLYKYGLEPCVMEAADPNADCQVDLGDVVYLINFLFREGSPPLPGCAH